MTEVSDRDNRNSARKVKEGFLSRDKELDQCELITEEEEAIVINDKALSDTDEYGISRDMFLMLTRIPTEKGLDAQDFRCPSCRKSIGGSFSAFKMCNLDAQYYCDECFKKGDESIIPSREMLNWDCTPRAIAKPSKAFIKSIIDRPLFHLDQINPRLYEHSKAMAKIQQLRRKLGLVSMYLLSCKQSVAEDLKRRLWPNDYLYSEIHQYSIMDFENVISGVLERRLSSVISFAITHINSCALCLQKGFICEICSAKRVIYPFQTDVVHRCKKCYSVYHRKCMEKVNQQCPKCIRRAKYAAMTDF
jgi:hypothetical protein